MKIVSELEKISPGNVLTSKENKIPYLRDASYYTGEFPAAVVIPRNTSELSRIMKFCYENDVQVVLRGGGSSLTGSSIPNEECILLSLSRFDKIIEVRVDDNYVIAEAGVRLDFLNDELSKFNYFYPPDPASSRVSTVGGTLATNAGGLHGVMYGVTKNWVLGMEVVLPNGEIVQLGGPTLKRSMGYDLAALMIGSEGTLGIITKAILRILPKPECSGRILAYYRLIEDAGKAVSELKNKGIIPLMAEFLDRISMDSIKQVKDIDYPQGSEYMLLVDIASSVESLSRHLELAAEILRKFDPVNVRITTDAKEMQKMYDARKGLYSSILSQRNSKSDYVIIGDVVVPSSETAGTLKDIQKSIEKHNLQVALFGHIGDGNIHTNIFADVENNEKMVVVEDFQNEVGMIAVKHRGSVSAEHGIGLEKKGLLLREFQQRHTEGTLEVMKIIKNCVDPKNILNRGKMFDL